jgi:chromosome segregation ATPase
MLQRLAVKDAYSKEMEARKEVEELKTKLGELRGDLGSWKGRAITAEDALSRSRAEIENLRHRLAEKEQTLSEHVRTMVDQGREIESLQLQLADSKRALSELEAASRVSEEEIGERYMRTEAGKALIYAEAVKINNAAIDNCRDKLLKVYPKLDVSCIYEESDDDNGDDVGPSVPEVSAAPESAAPEDPAVPEPTSNPSPAT